MDKVTCSNCGADNITNAKYCFRCGHTLPTITTEVAAETVQQPPAGNKKIKTLAGAIVGIAVMYGIQQFFFKPPSIDKMMMEAASEINKTCPFMVDQYTRFDNAVALPNKSFQYNYTLVDIEKSEVNFDTVKKYIEPGIINNVKTSPELKIYRDNKTTFIYYYRDKNGVFVFKLNVTPEMYEQ